MHAAPTTPVLKVRLICPIFGCADAVVLLKAWSVAEAFIANQGLPIKAVTSASSVLGAISIVTCTQAAMAFLVLGAIVRTMTTKPSSLTEIVCPAHGYVASILRPVTTIITEPRICIAIRFNDMHPLVPTLSP